MIADKKLDLVALLARLLIAFVFIRSGVDKMFDFDGLLGAINAKGFPVPTLLAALTIVLHFVGGLFLLAGIQVRWASALLALFTLAAGFTYHDYWNAPVSQRFMEKIEFDANLAIAGGLLAFVAFGPGLIALRFGALVSSASNDSLQRSKH